MTLLDVARATPPKERTKYQQAILDSARALKSYYARRDEVLAYQKARYHAKKHENNPA